MIVIFDYIFGKVNFKIYASSPETIINILRRKISVKDIIKNDNNTITFSTLSFYKNNVLAVCKENFAQANIVSESGIPVLYKKYSNRFGIILGFICSIIIVYISSGLIWEVKVTGNEFVDEKEIVSLLKDLGVSEGSKKNQKILENVYNSFLINESRISWISINLDGTVANVNVKETKIVPEKIDKTENINIVASCDGIVKRVDALCGTKEVNNGDAVKRGDLLISSFISSEKSGTVVSSARGSVWASTIHNFDIYVPKVLYQKRYDFYKNTYSLLVLGKDIDLSINTKHNQDIRIFNTENRVRLYDTIPLPFKIKKSEVMTSLFDEVEIDINEAKDIASAELSKRITDSLTNAEITEESTSVLEIDDGYIFSYELKCIENIAKEQ